MTGRFVTDLRGFQPLGDFQVTLPGEARVLFREASSRMTTNLPARGSKASGHVFRFWNACVSGPKLIASLRKNA